MLGTAESWNDRFAKYTFDIYDEAAKNKLGDLVWVSPLKNAFFGRPSISENCIKKK